MGLLSGSASAQIPPPFAGFIGGPGTGDGQFHTPIGIVFDAAGKIYVIDRGLARIQRFSSNGSYETKWSVPGGLIGIAIDGMDNLCIACEDGVRRYSTSGGLLSFWPMNMTAIGADAAGNVYSAWNTLIRKFSSDGTLLTQWGDQNQFDRIDGIHVDRDGFVYVADPARHLILKFSSSGVFQLQWGGFLGYPVRIASDLSRNIYVVDNATACVKVFTSTGGTLGQWGSPGTAPGQFLNPIGIAVNDQGTVLVGDTNSSRLQVFGSVPTTARPTSWGGVKSLYR
jgi:sugar lactone lactonase YvrE